MGIAPRWKGLAQSLEIWPLPFSWRQRLITWSPASQQEKVRVLNAIYKTTLMLIYATIPLLCNFSTFNSETQFDSLKWLINYINWLNDIDKNSYYTIPHSTSLHVPLRNSWFDRLLVFGAGRRVCLGETFAKNRLYLFVTVLLQRFTFVPEDPGTLPEVDPRSYDLGLVLHPKPFRVKAIIREQKS